MAAISKRKGRNGKIVYRVRIRRRGAKALSATFTRMTDAKLWINETEAALKNGKYFDRQEAQKHTLSDATERYKSIFGVDIQRKTHIERWNKELGHLLLSDLTSIAIADVLERWRKGPNPWGCVLSGPTLNRYLATLSSVLTAAARDWGWLPRNPVREVRRFKESRGRVRFLSDDEREKLLTACKESPLSCLYLVVILALSTGMRKNEIMTLGWSNVDLVKGAIILEHTKNHERRRVPLKGVALELMQGHSKVRRLDTDLVFPGQNIGGVVKPCYIRDAWVTTLDAVEINDFVFHDLRHSCASYLAMGGATLLEIAEILGHKTLQMVKRYSHLAETFGR